MTERNGQQGRRAVMSTAELARLAGVSRPMVSAVLNGKAEKVRMSAITRAKIEAIIRETGFRPSQVGKALATGRSAMVGLLMFRAHMSFIGEWIEAIEDSVSENGRGVLMLTTRGDEKRERDALQLMHEKRVEGIILAALGNRTAEQYAPIIELGVPWVCLGNNANVHGAGVVCVDGERVGRLVAEHVLACGYRSLAHAAVDEWVIRGIHGVFNENHAQVRVSDWGGENDWGSADNFVERWHASDKPEVVFIGNDEWACDAMSVAMRAGFRVPDDIAFIGKDDIPLAASYPIGLTTIAQPRYEQGEAASQLLLEMIDGKPSRKIILQPKLIVRQSTTNRK